MNSGSLLVPSLCHRKGRVLLAWYCGSAGEGPGVVTLVLWSGRGRARCCYPGVMVRQGKVLGVVTLVLWFGRGRSGVVVASCWGTAVF